MRIQNVMSEVTSTVAPGESLRHALLKMQFQELDSLPVVFKGRVLHRSDIVKVVGYEHPMMLEDMRLIEPLVETMCPVPAVVSTQDPVSAAAMYLNVFELSSVPVVNEAKQLVGLVTRGDVVTAAIPLLEEDERIEELSRLAA